ncbi:hypothetical protein B0T16DRAFT_402672 [Cercophora newfieldiana]|uniref:Uncharacterized protein n=1 Tax=Cercophora newfieldiana TaxID=92897 RepID=A0AA40D270_9PEZI|nr:hypothetical protein B0T16DRAFT_402672 [Cercophora newfieldiana]
MLAPPIQHKDGTVGGADLSWARASRHASGTRTQRSPSGRERRWAAGDHISLCASCKRSTPVQWCPTCSLRPISLPRSASHTVLPCCRGSATSVASAHL